MTAMSARHTGDMGATKEVSSAIKELECGYVSVENAITAFAGGGQGSAYQLTKHFSRVTTVGTAADSVKLVDAKKGRTMVVANKAAANSLNVFPQTGDAINALAANAAYAVAATKTVKFFCAVDGTWDTLLTA